MKELLEMLEKSVAAASSSGKLSWSTSTERREEAKLHTLLHEPKRQLKQMEQIHIILNLQNKMVRKLGTMKSQKGCTA